MNKQKSQIATLAYKWKCQDIQLHDLLRTDFNVLVFHTQNEQTTIISKYHLTMQAKELLASLPYYLLGKISLTLQTKAKS